MITKAKYHGLEELRMHIENIVDPTILIVSSSLAEIWEFPYINRNPNIIWIPKVKNNPTPATLYDAISLVIRSNLQPKKVLAIGGGSTLDLAKGIIAFLDYKKKNLTEESLREGIVSKSYLLNRRPTDVFFTAIPSTAGTGSEATNWATIWDNQSPSKFSIEAPWLYPDSIWLVPELTLGLSPRLTAATGMDAVTHATEAYWAKATDQLSKALSLQALQMLVPNLTKIKSKVETDSIIWRDALLTGSFIAGLAFCRTHTTACHSISYPLTSMFGIEHGFATAMTLGQVAKINKSVVNLDPIKEIFQPYGGIQSWVDNVCQGIFSMRLSAFGVESADIPTIVKNAFTGGRMDNNPVDLTEQDVTEILEAIWE